MRAPISPEDDRMTEADWEKLLEESPDDAMLRRAYADWLEESGQVFKGEGVRWYVDQKKCPSGPIAGGQWCWWSHEAWPGTEWDSDDLPGSLHECLPGWDPSESKEICRFASRIEAEKALYLAYVNWKELGRDSA
jgi:uncharacterized protein (TIGR02996 family)